MKYQAIRNHSMTAMKVRASNTLVTIINNPITQFISIQFVTFLFVYIGVIYGIPN